MNRNLHAHVVRYRREMSAILAAVTVTGIINQVTPLHTKTVAVATRDIAGGALIGAGDVALRNSLLTWSTAINKVDAVIGSRATRDLHSGQPLSLDDVTDPTRYAAADRVAVSIAVSPSDAHLVRAGDIIDLLATADSIATTVAAGAGVVSITGSGSAGVLATSSSQALVLAVTPTEARAIATAHDSTFTVVLRNRL